MPTHPLGILFYTLPHNFKAVPDRVGSIDLQINSGNIWGQPVTTFIPLEEGDRLRIEDIVFFSRIFEFDQDTSPSDSYSIQYDGIIKDIRMTYTLPVGKQSDLSLTGRSFVLMDGTFPFSTITGDRFIEFFHKTVAGGDDPFAREQIGLDKAAIAYTDRNGRELKISQGEFVFSGIEAVLYFYKKAFQNTVSLNFGTHLGVNLSRFNTSLDLGVSLAGFRQVRLTQKSNLLMGLGINLMGKDALVFHQNQPDLGTSRFFGSFEGHIEYSIKNKRERFHSFGLNYRIQTPYNNKKEEGYYVPSSPTRIARWHDASRHLYKFLSYWTLIYSITGKTEFSIFIQQDMLVNNVPDLQTGIRLRIPLFL
ncbi:hypothetical protein [Flagellimonas allohymeniacidonis]|uniref:DUF5723 domain-containing protein n=1 Tax=Flagellimonas allohymeniacidonis TaxID=2517819 RepID=A0A4Q8QB59_9FLAO|nr:hypothetical protein [Allomuricauda hymeniacidonis]TAI47565.1 hypothetical protein EW142_12925 [Allomuricauda hymeniacidonis]